MSQKLSLDVTFQVPARIIFSALMEPQEVMRYTRSPCQIEQKVGGKYSILDGRISGTFIEIDSNKHTAKLTWKMHDWKSESIVELSFVDRDGECTLEIKQSNVPSDVSVDHLRNGWMAQIFQPLSMICGYPLTR